MEKMAMILITVRTDYKSRPGVRTQAEPMLLSTDHTASKVEGTTITGNRMKIHTVTHASRRKTESKCNDAEITRQQQYGLTWWPSG